MEYDEFWKFHNKTNMDKHAVTLIERQAERIEELEDENVQWRNKAIGLKYELDNLKTLKG